MRAACAEKTRKLDTGMLWAEKELIQDSLITYTAIKTVDLLGAEKWPFSGRSDFVALLKNNG